MPTGACGINCDVCRLNLLTICSTCGPGKSQEAQRKIAAQEKILGAPCPILACAFNHGVDYCPRDCDRFPCDQFEAGPYPFSQAYLNMQERRRKESPRAKGSRKNNLADFALRFGLGLVDPIEKNHSNSKLFRGFCE